MPATETRIAVDPGVGHVVSFYGFEADLVAEVARFVAGAVEAHEVAILVATAAHHRAFAAGLLALGVDVEDACRQGLIVPLGAATLLSEFTTSGQIDESAFHTVIGRVVQGQVERGRGVRIFGEMVSLLWDEGHVVAALELEALWNELSRTMPFSLLCAYRTDTVSGAGQAEALERVCALHSSVRRGCESAPLLTAQFPANIDAPRAARHFVVDAVRKWGYTPSLVDDAALIVTELAANAVVHAASTFTVLVRAEDEGVDMAVEDSEPLDAASLIVRPGRGLGLVDGLSLRWGVDVSGNGKLIWAELGGSSVREVGDE